MSRYGSQKGYNYGSKGSSAKSRYTLFVGNVSSMTPKRDLLYEMERVAGPVVAATKDDPRRAALVEFKRTSDADYAYRTTHGVKMDGRRWEVRWATRQDFRDFGWKWTEGGYDSDEDERNVTANYNNNNLTSPPTTARARSRSPRRDSRHISPSPQRSGGSNY